MTGQFVKVEPGGTVFRGLAVPFDSPAYLVEADGRLVAEQFDEASITQPPDNIPLLVGHRRDEPPAGVITSSGISKFGLAIEGRLVGSDAEVEGWRRKFAHGLMASLSIGFAARGAQDWRAPERVGAPPIVIRRGVEIVEISLVTWPAYNSAAVVSVNQRTAASDESQRIIADATAYLADVRAYLAGRRGR